MVTVLKLYDVLFIDPEGAHKWKPVNLPNTYYGYRHDPNPDYYLPEGDK